MEARPAPSRPGARRICIVTSELAGPDYNGGIGTAVRGLALSLVRHGYAVDVLYTRVEQLRPHCFRGSFAEQVEAYRKLGVSLLSLAHEGPWNDWLAKSYLVMTHLADRPYDHVFFNDMHAEGYYSLLARATAHPGLSRTTMSVVLHSSTQWIAELNQQAVTSIETIRLMEMERRCVELADAVISPSAYMLRKYESYGWTPPRRAQVIPNLLPMDSQRAIPEPKARPVDEIVFFGRLERRKGLWLFCKAIERIRHEIGGIGITFLGKLTEEDGELTGFPLLKRSAAWPFEVRLLVDFDREQALNYLKGGRRVAVMPAPEDNSPCAILECLYDGIPFIAAGGSGGQELIAEDCWGRNLFEPTVDALTEKLRSVVREGASTGVPASRPEQNEAAILGWLERTIAEAEALHREREAQVGSGFPGEGTPSCHLVLLATSGRDPDRDVLSIRRAVDLQPEGTRITVLTGARDAIASRLTGLPGDRIVDVVGTRDYRELMERLAREGRVVGFCHVTEPLGPEWLDRAARCLRESPDIRALTGLTGLPGPPPEERPAHVQPGKPPVRVLDYRVGNSPVLFPLAADTNSGFVALRPDMLPELAEVGPFDEQYDRFKRMQDWVHEVVIRLAQGGHRFEVLVDPVVPASLEEDPSPVFRFGHIGRSMVGPGSGFARGGEQAFLARLAIEAQLGTQKRKAASASLARLSDKLGRRLDDPALYGSEERMARTLASMARASGQIELAQELIADQVLPRRERDREPRPLASAVRERSREIRLFDLVTAGAYLAFNLTHEWSFKSIAADREIEIHPNTYFEGRATMTFKDLDLTDLAILRGTIRVASPFSGPVRFRIDIVSREDACRFSLERVVRASESAELEEVLPSGTLTRCDVSLSTEMESPEDQTEGAWARWVDLRLVGPKASAGGRRGAAGLA